MYRLTYSDLGLEASSTLVSGVQHCTIAVDIEDSTEDPDRWHRELASSPFDWDPSPAVHLADRDFAPLMLTEGRIFLSRLFGAAIASGHACRIDLADDRLADSAWPVICTTADHLEQHLQALTTIATHRPRDVFPVHIWILPPEASASLNERITTFLRVDPMSDELYDAIIEADVVYATLAGSSCNLGLACSGRTRVMGWVKAAAQSSGLVGDPES